MACPYSYHLPVFSDINVSTNLRFKKETAARSNACKVQARMCFSVQGAVINIILHGIMIKQRMEVGSKS